MRRRQVNKFREFVHTALRMAKRRRTSEHPTDYQVLDEDAQGLEAEYRKIVAGHLQRWGVPESAATIDIRREGECDGKDVFVAVIGLVEWDRTAVVRLLLGLPLLDRKIRRAVETHWVADLSVFSGVQLKSSPALHGREAASELRHLIATLTASREGTSSGGSAETSSAGQVLERH